MGFVSCLCNRWMKKGMPIVAALMAVVPPAGAAGEREVFWGTPSYSYGERFVSPAGLSEMGVTYMGHLVYWNRWETARDRWDDNYIAQILQRMEAMARAGMRNGIRLGEAHPGAREWKTIRNKPYQGRNKNAYPGEEDTDDRYFAYLRKLVRTFRGKVCYYVLGDEIDMLFDASFRNEGRLREYGAFFEQAARAIREEDPSAAIVVAPFAWGYPESNLKLLHDWGYTKDADGIALNISHIDCADPAYLQGIGEAIRRISPRYRLFSNGFGYVSDRLPEACQARRLAHIMLVAWEAGFSYLPYYLPASNAHPWSSGLYRVNLQNGGIDPRQAVTPFRLLSGTLARRPEIQENRLTIESIVTPFGERRLEEMDIPKPVVYWNGSAESGFGIVRTGRMNSPLQLQARLLLRQTAPRGAVLVAVNSVNGERLVLETTQGNGGTVFSVTISNEPLILRWETL